MNGKDSDLVIGYITLTQLASLINKHPRTAAAWAAAGDIVCDVRRGSSARGVRYSVRVHADCTARVCGARVPVPPRMLARVERAA